MPEFRRSPEEIAKSMAAAKKMKAKETLKEQKGKIKSARNALMFLGILQCVFAFWEMYGMKLPFIAFAIDAGIGLAFIGLYFYAAENPKASFITGLIIYITIQLLVMVADPKSLFSGIILKAIIISVLVGGLKAVGRIPKQFLDKKNQDELLDNPTHSLDDL